MAGMVSGERSAGCGGGGDNGSDCDDNNLVATTTQTQFRSRIKDNKLNESIKFKM